MKNSKLRVLLTGDDGYNSTGTRILIHLLREKYDLFVAGTRTQQSAVGGKISLATGFEWCETEVDGIPALCVDGTPADATELVAALYDNPFDIVISGINWGVNLGSAIFGSGTVNAALRTLSVAAAKKGIAVSWDLPPKFYVMSHEEHEDIQPFLEYPGKTFSQLFEKIIEQQFWGADFLNINLPFNKTTEVKFTEPILSAQDIYDYSKYTMTQKLGEKKQKFEYTNTRKYAQNLPDESDVKTITNGVISITPCKYDILDEKVYHQLHGQHFALEK